MSFTIHFEVRNKNNVCIDPAPYIANDLPGLITETASAQEDDEDMTKEKFKELFNEMRKELQDNDCAAWSKDARNWAISTGLITGNGTQADGQPNYMWEDILTREQMIMVLYRFAQMMGRA